MSPPVGLLAVVSRPAVRDELDRIGAAVGIRVIHLADQAAVTRRNWLAAVVVLLDEAAAVRCANDSLPRRADVIVLGSADPAPDTWRAAVELGAQRVLSVPGDEEILVRALADATEMIRDGARPRGEVVAVVGGRGGAGASLFAVALAQCADDALLVDLDSWGGGIDLLVGSENASGLRWPDLALQGGRLTWSAVREALPRHPGRPGLTVLSGVRHGYQPDGDAVAAVVDAGRRGGAVVVCDLPRDVSDAVETALDAADLVVLISPCDVRSSAATAAFAPRLRAVNPNVGLVVRGPSPGGLRAGEVADVSGLPLLATMRAEPRLAEQLEHGGLRLPRRSSLAAAAHRVLAVLPSRRRSPTARVAAQ